MPLEGAASGTLALEGRIYDGASNPTTPSTTTTWAAIAGTWAAQTAIWSEV